MNQNETLIVDHLRHIRATLAEIAEDISAVKASIASIEKHAADCARGQVPFVQDSPSISS